MIPSLQRLLARLGVGRAPPEPPIAELLARAARGEQDAGTVSGIDALCRLLGEQDALPTPGSPALDREELSALAARLGLDPPTPAGERFALWTWRDRGRAVAHVRMLRRPARIFLDAQTGLARWDLPGLPLLASFAGEGGELLTARIDGRKLRLRAANEAAGWRRELLGQGSRLIIRDRGSQRLCFDLPTTLIYAPVAGGWNGAGEGLRLELRVDPSWRWTLDEGRLVGHGELADAEVQTSVELRA